MLKWSYRTEFSPWYIDMKKTKLTKWDQYNNVGHNEVHIKLINLQQEQTRWALQLSNTAKKDPWSAVL